MQQVGIHPCDMAVIKDTLGLDRIHEFKVNKYDKPDIHRWMKQNNPIADAGLQKGLITALILNWRGTVLAVLEFLEST